MDKSRIRLLALDVDGTLTDGKIYMGEQGEVFKAFDIKDGCGLHDVLPQYGIRPVVITGRKSKIVENRCRELEIGLLFQGVKNKAAKLAQICAELEEQEGIELSYENIAYMGDDIIDDECMEKCGISACPADAWEGIRKKADFVSRYDGGHGAVREFIDWLTAEE